MNNLPRLLIVDDEPLARSRLLALLGDAQVHWPHQIVGEAANGQEALDAVREHNPDVVLLDVQMPVMSGIEVAKQLSAMPHPPAIVFVTAYDDFAVQAFEVQAFDYLMKPVRLERLQAALMKAVQLRAAHKSLHDRADKAAAEKSQRRTTLAVYERGKLILVPVESIVYFKAELKYVTIRTQEREYLTEESLISLEQEFAPRFIRVHRNALVAREAVAGFTRVTGDGEGEEGGEGHWEVMLRNIPDRLPVSRRQWAQVRALVKG